MLQLSHTPWNNFTAGKRNNLKCVIFEKTLFIGNVKWMDAIGRAYHLLCSLLALIQFLLAVSPSKTTTTFHDYDDGQTNQPPTSFPSHSLYYQFYDYYYSENTTPQTSFLKVHICYLTQSSSTNFLCRCVCVCVGRSLVPTDFCHGCSFPPLPWLSIVHGSMSSRMERCTSITQLTST